MPFFASLSDLLAGRPLVGRSPAWPALARKWVTAHPTCAACGTARRLEVHHLRPVHVAPELELSEQNLLALCREHHLLIGHLGAWISWNSSAVADAAWWLQKVRARPGWLA